MAIRSVALVNRSTLIDLDEVRQVAAAIQRQVIYDFGPTWGHTGVVIALPDGEPLPQDYYAVYLYDALSDDRLGGIRYYTDRGEIYANVAVGKKPWSLHASHEVLEMIVDPTTDWKQQAPSLRAGQGMVEYLVEICDPCQHYAFSYNIDKVVVSDFYSRSYFDTFGATPGRYSMTGSITKPLQILPGGYLSWRDVTGQWWRGLSDGSGKVTTAQITGFNTLPGDSIREKIDFYSATLPTCGCTVDLGKKFRKQVAARNLALKRQCLKLDAFGNQRRLDQEAHHQGLIQTVKAYDAKRKQR